MAILLNIVKSCFPCSSSTARDGEVIQRQHFCHHGGTICHPKSSYVTTELYGTSTYRCNNNAIFSDRAMFTFSPVAVFRSRKPATGRPYVRAFSLSGTVPAFTCDCLRFVCAFTPRPKVDLCVSNVFENNACVRK